MALSDLTILQAKATGSHTINDIDGLSRGFRCGR
jgi:hypothetical protein